MQRDGLEAVGTRAATGHDLGLSIGRFCNLVARNAVANVVAQTVFCFLPKMLEHFRNEAEVAVALPSIAGQVEASQVSPGHEFLGQMTELVVGEVQVVQSGNSVESFRVDLGQVSVEADRDELEVLAAGEGV